MRFTLLSEGLPTTLCQKIMLGASVQVRVNLTRKEHLTRMTSLFDLAKDCCTDERERQALDQVFSDWWVPGFDKKVDLS